MGYAFKTALNTHLYKRQTAGSRRDQEEGGGAGPSREPRRDQEEGGGAGPSREPRRDQEEGGGAGPSREPRGDQEQGGGAGPSREPRRDQKLRTAVETAISEVHKLLGTGGVPTSLTLLFWRWLTVSSVFTGRRARAICLRLPPLPLLLLDRIALRPQKRSGSLGTGTGGRGRKSEGLTADTSRKRPWTAARTMEVLKRCPLAIAQRLVHCQLLFQLPCLGRVTRTMSVALLLTNNSKGKKSSFRSPAPPPYSRSLPG